MYGILKKMVSSSILFYTSILLLSAQESSCDSLTAGNRGVYEFGHPEVLEEFEPEKDIYGDPLRDGKWLEDVQKEFLGSAESWRSSSLSGLRALPDYSQYSVGTIPYEEGVTPFGGKSYTIAVPTASGFNYVPSVALSYNSQGGDGVAGYGWSIGGVSSITVISKSQYYQGTTAPALADDSSRAFALDGSPLVANPKSALLSAGYQYETAYGQVAVCKHTSDGVVTHFTAIYPDGTKATFGWTDNTSNLYSYPITESTDRQGNKIVYEYTRTEGSYGVSYRLTAIYYGYSGSPSTYGARMTFSYQTRSDAVTKYYAGRKLDGRWLLKSVASYSGSSLLVRYDLTHEEKEGTSLLTGIGCTKGSLPLPLPPVSIAYTESVMEGTQSPSMTVDASVSLSQYFPTGGDFIYRRGRFVPGSDATGV